MDSNKILRLIITYFGFLVALTMREAARAYTARALGDNSPEVSARATINPVPHIDLVGTVIAPIFMLFLQSVTQFPLIFGWAKPLDISMRNFKKIKRDIYLVAISGTAMNFTIAVVSALLLRSGLLNGVSMSEGASPFPLILQSLILSNLVIGVFNILPIPNSDGWRILLNTVNYNTAQKLNNSTQIISLIVLMLIISGAFKYVLTPVIVGFMIVFGIRLF